MDEGAVEELSTFYRRVRPRLVGALALYCGDPALAEDLAQEALVRAWERWDTVGRLPHRDRWVNRTAFNLASSGLRRRGAERRANRMVSAGEMPVVVLPDTPTAIAVRDAVRQLSDRQRAAVVTRFYLGLGVDEAADVLGCRPGTVKALTFQAIARLRQLGLTDSEEEVPHVRP